MKILGKASHREKEERKAATRGKGERERETRSERKGDSIWREIRKRERERELK